MEWLILPRRVALVGAEAGHIDAFLGHEDDLALAFLPFITMASVLGTLVP